jgi:hypothetical protein
VISGSLVMEGVAYDHDAREGTGVDRVSVRICGLGGQSLGDALLGLPSTTSVNQGDAQFANAGWKLTGVLRGAGELRDLCVTARSSVTGTETLVRIPITIGTAPPPPGRPTDAAPAAAGDAGPSDAGPGDPGTGGTAPDTSGGGANPDEGGPAD